MKLRIVSAASMASLLVHGPVLAKEGAQRSWFKPGVTFAQYRQDAIRCATIGYFRDVSRDRPATEFANAARTADVELNMPGVAGPDTGRYLDLVRRARPAERIREVQAIQTGDTEDCLTGAGYRRFVLSPADRKMLDRYKPGSANRHRFLYGLSVRAARAEAD